MHRIRFSPFLYAGLLLVLAACQAVEPSSPGGMLRPGDAIAGMHLGTGAQDAPPLWAFCSTAQQESDVITYECELPALPSLAIGNLPFPAGDELEGVEWSTLRWDLSLDDRPLDLEAFGTYRGVVPVAPNKPSPLPEVFREFTAWDIVLSDLTPGEHRLYGVAQTGMGSQTWVLHFIIKASG